MFGLIVAGGPLALAGGPTTQEASTQPSPATQPVPRDPAEGAPNPVKQSAAKLRLLGQAVMMFANDNKGKLPADLSQLSAYLGATMLENPRTGAEHGYEYVKPGEKIHKIRSPQDVPMAYELDKDGKRLEGGWVLYVDGHVAVAR